MTTHRRPMIAKVMAIAAFVLSSHVGPIAAASADPDDVGTNPNPFGALTCNCRQTAPAGSPARKEQIDRGLREGLSVWMPGLTAPAQPRQPQPSKLTTGE
jgi:hypothetical protein